MMKWFKRKPKPVREDEAQAGHAVTPEPESVDDQAESVEAVGFEAAMAAESPALMETEQLRETTEAPIEESFDEPFSPEAGRTPESRRFFKRLRERLHKTRENLTQRVDRLVLGKKQIDVDLLDELEEILITSDIGVATTQLLLKGVTEKVERRELRAPEKLREELSSEIQRCLAVTAPEWNPEAAKPFVIMIVGVNGVGKTTTIGKLAHRMKNQGLEVLLVAGDTFRAAAIEQLVLWGERVGVPVVRQKSGSDPSAVAFDAMEAALARKADVVLLDTAGRMHTKVNLMEEVKKVQRVIKKKIPDAPHEVLLVLDATTGQNALSQARLFKSELGVTGLIMTKLDGTAKGGILVAVSQEIQAPVRFIGIGEGTDDLQPFDATQFARAIF